VIDISTYMDGDAAYLRSDWLPLLPALSYVTLIPSGESGLPKTFLRCDPSVWGRRIRTYLSHGYTLLVANPKEINLILAPNMPQAMLETFRHTCYAVLAKNTCSKSPWDSCRHNADTRLADPGLPNVWAGGRLPTAADVATLEAFTAFGQAALNLNPEHFRHWYDVPLNVSSIALLLSGGTCSVLSEAMIADAKVIASRILLGRLEVGAANGTDVHPLLAHTSAVVVNMAWGSPASESIEQARSDSALFHQMEDMNAAANLALLRWLRNVHEELTLVVLDPTLEGDELSAAAKAAVAAILKYHPAPAGYRISDTPSAIEDFILGDMDWSVTGEFREGAFVSLPEVLAAFAEFLKVADHFAATTGYMVPQVRSSDGSKTPKAARRLTLPAQPPVPDEVEKEGEANSGTSSRDFISTRSHLLRSVNDPKRIAPTLLATTNYLPAAASLATAGGGPAPSTSAGGCANAAFQFGGGTQGSRNDSVDGGTAVPAGVLHTTSTAGPPPAPPQTLESAADARLDRMEQQTGLLQQQIAQLLANSTGRSFGHNPSGTLSGQPMQAPAGNAAHHQQLHEQALAEGDAHRRHLQEQQRQQPHSGGVGGANHHLTSEFYRAPPPQFHGMPTINEQALGGGDAHRRHLQEQQRQQPHSGGVGGANHHLTSEFYRAPPPQFHPWSNGRDTGGPPQHVQSLRPQDHVEAGYSRAHPGDLCLSGGPVPHPSALPTQPQYDPHRPPPFYAPHQNMQRQYDDVAQPAAGAFAPNVSSVPEPWNLCGDIFANVNIGSPEQTALAFGELHDLPTPLMYASKNCEQSYWERHNLISSHQNSTLIKMSASGSCIEELKRRFASEAADTRAWSTSIVKEFTATPDAFDAMVSSMQSLCSSMSRPFRFGSLPHVFISQTRDFVLSLALFKATQLQAGVPWSDIMNRYRSLFASFAALRTFCEQRSARYGKVWFHVRLMAYLSHVSSSVTPWIDDGVRDSRAIITSKAIRDLESAQKSALSKLASEQSAALARIEKAALAAASASKAAETSAAIRRRDQRLCKGCSVHAGADRRTLCHTRVGADGSAVGCPNAAQAANYPANGYK
jgi:hypothetical protein